LYFQNDANLKNTEIMFERRIDLRYLGQEHTVTVTMNTMDETVSNVLNRFHDAHEKTYTFKLEDTPVEFVTYRLTAAINVPRPKLKKLSNNDRSIEAAYNGKRTVNFAEDGIQETNVYERNKIPSEVEIPGPLIVEEATSTTLVHPKQQLRVDKYGFLRITNI
jgi:N-methylhydantoinase A